MSWSKDKALKLIRDIAVIPVFRVSSREDVLCGVSGIIDAGLPVAEITLTIPNALKIIEELAHQYGDKLLIGAGTVLDAESCGSALMAGANFIVSPVFHSEVVEIAQKHGQVCIPGALTPTEVLAAWRGGADLVKVFPCGAAGGPSYIKALGGPFPQIELVVTGSVTLENVPDFLAAGTVAVGVGESILERSALMSEDVDTISSNARRFVEAVSRARAPRKGN